MTRMFLQFVIIYLIAFLILDFASVNDALENSHEYRNSILKHLPFKLPFIELLPPICAASYVGYSYGSGDY